MAAGPRLRTGIIAAIFVATVVLPATPATAKVFCLGRKATKVGTSGADTLVGTKKDDVIVGMGGDDTIFGKGGNDRMCGSEGTDALFGQGGKDLLDGEEGGDQVSGGKGDDVLDGGVDDDLSGGDYVNYFPSLTPVTLNLAAGIATGEGRDKLRGIENVFGSPLADSIGGDDETNLIQPLGGDDQVRAGGGLDIVYDGTGGDAPAVDGDDKIDGGEGPDAVYYGNSPAAVQVDLALGAAAGDGTDEIAGIEGIFGSSFDDTLSGNGQRNLLLGAMGDDHLDGRGANDAAGFWASPGPVSADLSTDSATGAEGNDELTSIEGLLGSVFFSDTLRGDDANNLLDGDGGDDQLFGMGGNDWMTGAAGNDQIDGGAGDFDLADYSSNAFQQVSTAVDVDLFTGAASGGAGNDNLTGIEAVAGSSEGDVLAGDQGANVFFGGGGDDDVGAGGGDDKIDGGPGVDNADAGEGIDKCRNVETTEGCENENAQDISSHPIEQDAADIALYRRNI